jgi:alpha-L-fucosidase
MDPSRPVPRWFDDAKLGVFIHWGLYSVPGWAPRTPDIQRLLHDEGPRAMLREIPYAEWYLNSMAIEGSPTWDHHRETYGADFAYDDFIPTFDAASAEADIDAIAALAHEAGAGYVVLTSKHSDGFALWPSPVDHPRKGEYHASRDLVGGLTDAVRARGLRMGLYYCGGFDWPSTDRTMRRGADMLLAIPTTAEYERFAAAQVRDLIERYRPSVLWGDVAWPVGAELEALMADYYAAVPDGVVNDRWAIVPGLEGRGRRALLAAGGRAVEALWSRLPDERRRLAFPPSRTYDFRTPEYEIPDTIREEKWELARGVGNSFGLNRNEDPNAILSVVDLVRMLCDVVARNGNLLIGVGPDEYGRIPDDHAAPLRGLGAWMRDNGAAIVGSRPWTAGPDPRVSGGGIRYTVVDGTVHVLVDATDASEVALEGVRFGSVTGATILSTGVALEVLDVEGGPWLRLPETRPDEPVHAIRLHGDVRPA